jgi:hypothetical protein
MTRASYREQIARRLGRGADRADPRGYVAFAGELLARLYFRHFRLLPAEHLGQVGAAEGLPPTQSAFRASASRPRSRW